MTIQSLEKYKVVLLDHLGDPGADGFGRIDITSRVNVLEVIDGAPISATITLDAQGGKFIGQTPVVKVWDRIYLELTDKNNLVFKTVVHVKKPKPVRKEGMGLQLKLICPHESSNLMTQLVAKPNLPKNQTNSSGFFAMNDLVAQVNANRGTKDPQIVIQTPFDMTKKFGNRLNSALSNAYVFEAIKFQDAVDFIITKEADVIGNGGAFQFHFFRLQSMYNYSDNSNLGNVALQVFEQGYMNNAGVFNNTPQQTIVKKAVGASPAPYVSTDGDLDSEQGTNILVVADKQSGTYPKDYADYQGQLDAFRSAQTWNSTTQYLAGQRVFYQNNYYQCTNTLPAVGPYAPPPSDLGHWTTPQTFVPTVHYSPLTKTKAQYFINACGGWLNANVMNAEVAMFDPNIIIKDKFHNRTWVDMQALSTSVIDDAILLPGSIPFDGLRILVAGTGSGGFAGSDPNGVPYSNNVLEYRGTFGIDGAWYVFRVSQQDDEVYSMREGDSWTYKPCQDITLPVSYVDGNGVCQLGARNGGWVKGAYGLIGVPNVGTFGHFFTGLQFDCIHPVKHDAGPNVEIGNEKISPTDLDGNSAVFANFACTQGARNFYAGLNFAWPWPRNSNGRPYGTVNIGEQIMLFVFDLMNMYKTHTGKRQWFGPEVEDYFPINGFSFFELLQDYFGGGILKPEGDYSMGLFLIDRYDTVVTIEFTHGHNNVPESQNTPLGKIKIYRGIPGISTWLPAQQIEILDIFDPRSVIRGGIYTRDSFDQAGRYQYGQNNFILPGFTSGSRFRNSEKLHLSVDGFVMTKPLVSTNVKDLGSAPLRNITPQIVKADNVVSKFQSDSIAKGLEKIYNFQPKRYVINGQMRCNVNFGDPVYYTDVEMIADTTDGHANTLKTVASSITYTVSKTNDGPGGFTRALELITRVWPN